MMATQGSGIPTSARIVFSTLPRSFNAWLNTPISTFRWHIACSGPSRARTRNSVSKLRGTGCYSKIACGCKLRSAPGGSQFGCFWYRCPGILSSKWGRV